MVTSISLKLIGGKKNTKYSTKRIFLHKTSEVTSHLRSHQYLKLTDPSCDSMESCLNEYLPNEYYHILN